jgi:type IV pilus assembly protein PilC
MKYECTVGFPDGSVSSFKANIDDLDNFREALLAKDVFLIEARPEVFKFSFSFVKRLIFLMGRTKRLINFTKLFSTLVKAGVNIDEALKLLIEDEPDQEMKSRLSSIRNDVLQGNSLSAAMAKEPDLFDTMYSRSVMAGERSGNLPGILQRMLFFYKKQHEMKKKVLMALIYPLILSFIAVLAIIALITMIIPKFTLAFENMDIELPAYTKFVIGLSDFFTTYGFFIIIFLIMGGYTLSSYFETPKGKRQLDTIKLALPVLGTIIGFSTLSNFLRTLATMLKGGIPLVEALVITEKSVGNTIYAEKISLVIQDVEKGDSFHECLKKSGMFPPLLVKMVKIGEESGTLDEMLEEASMYFDDEVDTMSTTLASLLEPLMMMALAVVFLGIMLAIMLPLISASSSQF